MSSSTTTQTHLLVLENRLRNYDKYLHNTTMNSHRPRHQPNTHSIPTTPADTVRCKQCERRISVKQINEHIGSRHHYAVRFQCPFCPPGKWYFSHEPARKHCLRRHGVEKLVSRELEELFWCGDCWFACEGKREFREHCLEESHGQYY